MVLKAGPGCPSTSRAQSSQLKVKHPAGAKGQNGKRGSMSGRALFTNRMKSTSMKQPNSGKHFFSSKTEPREISARSGKRPHDHIDILVKRAPASPVRGRSDTSEAQIRQALSDVTVNRTHRPTLVSIAFITVLALSRRISFRTLGRTSFGTSSSC